MPILFIPFAAFAASWIVCMVGAIDGTSSEPTARRTTLGMAARVFFVIAATFGGALLATYVSPFKG